MGELVRLDDRRRRDPAPRLRPERARGTLWVDLADPFSYLVAERVERALPVLRWRLASQAVFGPFDPETTRAAAERRAEALRLPLQWPDGFPHGVPGAMRAAAHAIEAGLGGPFLLAAGRLAFSGGFDLDEPDVLVEAAAAAGLGLEDCLRAARDRTRDAPIEAASRRLLEAGATKLPVLRAGGVTIAGEAAISRFLVTGAPRAATRHSARWPA